jgi:hypothetical protein
MHSVILGRTDRTPIDRSINEFRAQAGPPTVVAINL